MSNEQRVSDKQKISLYVFVNLNKNDKKRKVGLTTE